MHCSSLSRDVKKAYVFYWASCPLLRATRSKCDSDRRRVYDYDDNFLDISPLKTVTGISDTVIFDTASTSSPKIKLYIPGVFYWALRPLHCETRSICDSRRTQE